MVRGDAGAGVRSADAVRWRNWSRTQACTPRRTFYPGSLADLVDIVRQAGRDGRRIRVAGRGHSIGPLSMTDDYLIDVAGLNRIGPVDRDRRLATVETGVTVAALDRELRRHGLAMPTNVVLTCVQYGGVIATGSHGGGRECQTISDLVEAMTIVTHTGQVVTFTEDTHGAEVMNAVRCNLGTLGVIYQITLRVEPMFRLMTVDRHAPQALIDDPGALKDFLGGNDYTDVLWFPLAERLWTKTGNRTSAPATPEPRGRVPLEFAANHLGARLARLMVKAPRLTRPTNNFYMLSYVPRHRSKVREIPDAIHYRHSVEVVRCYLMSFAFRITADYGAVRDAWRIAAEVIHRHAADGRYPLNLQLEMRVIRNSRALLSPAHGADDQYHCYLDLLSHIGTPGCFEAFDEVALGWMGSPHLKARPHWGKYFDQIPGIVPYIHDVWRPSLQAFTRFRDELDPGRMFLNPALEEILYPARPLE